jgi:hypothetical protein
MWTQEDSGRVKTPLEPLVLGATLLLIPALIIQADVESGAWLTVAYIINWIVWSVFVVEFALIMIVATASAPLFALTGSISRSSC